MSIHVDIRKSFDDFALDVAFEAGNEVVGLLGASGCGKSMTLKSVAGILRPDKGRIVVDGNVLFDSEKGIDLSPQKRRVGLLFQNYALFPNMTVEENIRVVLRSASRGGRIPFSGGPEGRNSSGGIPDRGVRGESVSERAARLVEKFHLRGLERHYPAQLSGGQQQRAALARIMAGNPSILMLDEPLSALDSYLRWQLEGELLQILEEFKGTTLYVSHNRDEVYRLCEKVCVIDLGRSEGARPKGIRPVKELFEFPNTFASAILSGCKNYSRAVRVAEHSVRAVDWGVDLACAAEVPADVCYIGVRAHNIAFDVEDDKGENVFGCRVIRVVQDVFGTIVNIEPLNAANTGKNGFSRIRAEFPKQREDLRGGDVTGKGMVSVRIAPEHVMLLKK